MARHFSHQGKGSELKLPLPFVYKKLNKHKDSKTTILIKYDDYCKINSKLHQASPCLELVFWHGIRIHNIYIPGKVTTP